MREEAEGRAIAEIEKAVEADARAEAETARSTESIARARAEKQKTRIAIAAGLLAAIALGLGLFAQTRLDRESQQKALASGALIGKAETLLKTHNQLEALEASVEALSQFKEIGQKDSSELQRIQTVISNVKEQDRLQAHKGGAYGLSFSPDGKTIVSGGEDGSIRIWNLSNNKVSPFIKEHSDAVKMVKFSPDGQLFASASLDKTVKIWDIQGNLIHSFDYGDYVYNVSFSKSNQKIAASGLDRGVIIWDLKTRKIFRVLKKSDYLTSDFLKIRGIAFSPMDESVLVTTGTEDKFDIIFWNVNNKIPKPKYVDMSQRGATFSVDFSPMGDMVVSCDDNGNVYLRNAKGELIGKVTDPGNGFYYVTFSADGKLIATADSSTDIKIWQVDELLREWRKNHSPVINPYEVLKGNSGAVTRLSFQRSNSVSKTTPETILASADEGGIVRVWHFNRSKINVSSHTKEGSVLLQEACTSLGNYLKRNSRSRQEILKICGI